MDGSMNNSCHHSISILSRLPIKFSSFNPASFPIKPSNFYAGHDDDPYYKKKRKSKGWWRRPITAALSTLRLPQRADDDQCSVKFQTLRACKLGISRYPDFDYNAEEGGGTGYAIGRTRGGMDQTAHGIISVSFDVDNLYIPPLSSATTRFLGLPLPPFLKIDIVPELLQGTISEDEDTGKVDLEFRAKFMFSVGSIYRAPPLMVETVLTSEESKGSMRSGRGERLDGQGRCRLVGVARVDPIGDSLVDSFLGLPTECIAILNARILMSISS